jgi:hypothetical protein
VIVYSKDATADRAFFRDVLGFSSVDAGHDWLIFALPSSLSSATSFTPSRRPALWRFSASESVVDDWFVMTDDEKKQVVQMIFAEIRAA